MGVRYVGKWMVAFYDTYGEELEDVYGVFVFFVFRKLGIALSVSTKTMSAIPSFGFRIQGLVLGFLKTVGLAVDWYKDLDIRNTSQKFVC